MKTNICTTVLLLLMFIIGCSQFWNLGEPNIEVPRGDAIDSLYEQNDSLVCITGDDTLAIAFTDLTYREHGGVREKAILWKFKSKKENKQRYIIWCRDLGHILGMPRPPEKYLFPGTIHIPSEK